MRRSVRTCRLTRSTSFDTNNSYGPSGGGEFDPSTWPDVSAPGDTITSSCRIYLPICSTGLDLVDVVAAADAVTP